MEIKFRSIRRRSPSPYKSVCDKRRQSQYRGRLKSCGTLKERMELTYGYFMHEFELSQSKLGLRPPLPDFEKVYRPPSVEKKTQGRETLYENRKSKVITLMSGQTQLSSDLIGKYLNIEAPVAHNLMDVLYRKNVVDRFKSKRVKGACHWIYKSIEVVR